ncbi:MAG: threonine synthase [Kiritimatiellae bacterium]|nr:threonine synthase [Kiritimatiellia bacterium]
MEYLSTRGGDARRRFRDTVLTGQARDGGLLLPAEIPDARDRLPAWSRLAYPDLAFEIMRLFADDLPPGVLRALIAGGCAAFRHPEVTPVVTVGRLHMLELFHGPTLAFKDVALQFLGALFEQLLSETRAELNILAATSGDTGSAAIQGVRGRPHLRIFVLHPHGRVSPIQALQMTSVLDDNVHNLAVEGTFDDCQSIVKTLFADLAFRDRHCLGAVNSINWARVLAQMVYYFYAAFRVIERTGAARVSFSVPTGNFGDIFAGYLAWRMGLPVARLLLATNENDILARCFESGLYRAGPVAPTLSPSMDIQVASNFERYLYYRAGGDSAQVRAWMEQFRRTGELRLTAGGASLDDPVLRAGRGDTEATLATIRSYWERHRYLLDPHTAVGVYVAERNLDSAVPTICLATAHPAKFGDAIRRATGADLARHPILDALPGLPTRVTRLPATRDAVAGYLEAALVASFFPKAVR